MVQFFPNQLFLGLRGMNILQQCPQGRVFLTGRRIQGNQLGLQLQQMKMTSNQAAQAGKGQLVGILYFGSRGLPRPALKKFGHEGILLTFFSFFD